MTEADKAAAEEIMGVVRNGFVAGVLMLTTIRRNLESIIAKHMAPERQATAALQESLWQLEEEYSALESQRNAINVLRAALCEEIERLKFHNAALMDMNATDWRKLVEWLKNPDRKPSIFAFTAGIARQAAAAVEQSGILKEKA